MSPTPQRQLIAVDIGGGVHDLGTLAAVTPPVVAADGTVRYTITAQLWPDERGVYGWPYVV
jgi:hypothetical protein